MEYINKDKGSYNLHLIKTNRFKTITIRICFKDKINKNDITIRNFLSNFLVYSTATYPTKREMVLKSEDLYATDVYTKCYRSGRYNIINFNMTLLNEKYTEQGMLEESIKFLSDILFNPNFKDSDRYNETFNFLYKQIEKSLLGYKEHKSSYSIIRMLEEMGKDKEYGYRDIGYIEDLEQITRDKLIAYYNKMINNSLIDIYIIGNVDNSIEKIIDKYFTFNTIKRPKVKPLITDKCRRKIVTVKESDDSTQSKLAIGCKIDKLTEFERNYVLTIYNLILGGCSESKFFQEIREKNSLAYYCNSTPYKLDSLLIIKAGISKENYKLVIKLIKKLMKEMEKGNFTEEQVDTARENYISLLNEIYDNPDAIIETYVAKDLLNIGDIEERKEEVLKVTKKDIINISKKINIDTIFLLEGIGDSN